MSFLTFVSILLLSTLANVNGYKIDVSCANAGVGLKVEFALQQAFAMAEAGKAALQSGHEAAFGTDIQRPFELEQLIHYLFYKGDNKGQDIKRMPLSNVFASYTGILNYIKAPGNVERPSANDIIIYCDDSRFEKHDTLIKKWATDTSTGMKVKYDERPCHGGIAESLALAVTWRGLVDPKIGKMFPNQLQICPWFLELVKISPYTSWQDVSKKSLFGLKVITKNEENKWGFRQIDAVNLLDKVLLHEMTHTDKGGWTADVSIGRNILAQKKPAYGWSRCKDLATGGSWDTEEDYNAPTNNADTLALFGSICQMMSDTENPRGVDEEGRVVPLDHTVEFE